VTVCETPFATDLPNWRRFAAVHRVAHAGVRAL